MRRAQVQLCATLTVVSLPILSPCTTRLIVGEATRLGVDDVGGVSLACPETRLVD